MLKMIPLPYKLAAIAIVVAAVFGYGYMKGQDHAESKFEKARQNLQQKLFDLADDLSVKNSEYLQLLKEREELIHDLEIQAIEAPGSDNPGVGSTGGLQRLDSRWER